ncbi:outer dense fiber protein 2 isoform X2 [Coregonus clupeaformis]|uniref:outer dense fiber protein 2 isoform X2 n=1 Tax=Coregonus clupeaformis TaxID=59861 RepID=UPI001E1C878D|nr:outer dense fiber protein 2 isoform X2 [Coregonus clupeaformis]
MELSLLGYVVVSLSLVYDFLAARENSVLSCAPISRLTDYWSIMKTRDSSPPLHVHVPETTHVHVHLKRSQKSGTAKTSQVKKVQIKGDIGNLRARTRARAPWVPATGRSATRDDAYKWKLADLSNEDKQEQRIHGQCNKYMRKIDGLMMDVGSPKNEVKLRKKERLMEHQSECLSACQRVIDEQEEELLDAAKELDLREREKISIQHSLRKRGETGHNRAYSGTLHGERDMLLRKLVEAEFDGVAVVTQLTALNESMGGVKKDKRFSKADAALLGRQQELLTKKIETFDSTNRTLRELLRECHEREIESLRTSEQRQGLLKRLVDTEAEKVHLAAKLNNKEKEANQLAVHLDFEKDIVKTTGELSKVLESTCSQLMVQLRSKETENNRQAGHSKEMEQTQEQQKEEIQALLEQLEELKRQSEEDKERLKQANQTQRHRAEHSEDSARQLSAQLLEKETELAEALTSAESWCTRHSKEVTVKSQLEVEIAVLKNQVSELTAQIHTVEEKGHQEREGLLDRLHRLTSDNSSNKLENQKLKTTLSAAEENLMQSQSKAQQLKNSVKKLESQVENYKRKVQRARLESEEYCLKLEISEKHTQEMKADLEREIEQVRRQLLGHLKELESLPERLKRSELQLREAQDETHTQERRNTEQNNTLSELRHKVEQQGCWVETFQEKNLLLVEEHKTLQQKMESIERKLEEANLQNRDMVHVIGKREETIHSTQKQLEERARVCSILSKQLEQAFEDGQRQADQSLERALLKERSIQAKALDLESQLGLKRTELSQLRRSKEDMERRFQNQLKNMKERLEQSDSTNRSLQNYVQFLKASYSNVFGDSVLSSGPL